MEFADRFSPLKLDTTSEFPVLSPFSMFHSPCRLIPSYFVNPQTERRGCLISILRIPAADKNRSPSSFQSVESLLGRSLSYENGRMSSFGNVGRPTGTRCGIS